ncbi:SprB repeat-containing protein [Hymenobacter sp. ASUV-10]|uniref:SprB repeat-containing protein n=1 Tax=Hymenobacter aranciens TaxID=3063996 RepID=A0ABT9BJ38_9BACT|nr:SprB repeat-containing protein [Hymenobacter sp. ASUV-10]MDO7877673.1 SprB repeat-containing protein [Hymenobacter sp. ASUV-10]
MLIELITYWTISGTYGSQADQVYGTYYEAETWYFDTATRQVVHTPRPLGGFYQQEQSAGDPPPTSYNRPTTEEFHFYATGADRIGFFHDGVGGFTTVIDTLTISTQVVNNPCFGNRLGQILVAVGGLTGPFTYAWDDGPTTRDRSLVAAGGYRLTVRDVSGAVASALVTVGENPEILVVVSKTGGDVSLQVSGGTSPYSLLWSDGATTANRLGLAAGPYSCTITDAVGCSKTVEVLVNVNQFFWSRNPIVLALDAGAAYRANPATKPNLTFLCEVWLETAYLSGVFEQVGPALEQPADAQGRTVFDVQALLDAYLDWHVPAPTQFGLQRADPLFRRFYLAHAESFGTPAVRAGTTVRAQNYVVKGGLSFYEQQARTWHNSYQPSVRPFLTWEPPTKSVLLDQPEYLYYQAQPLAPDVLLRVRVIFADGTTHVSNYGSASQVQQYEVYAGAVGYAQLGLGRLDRPANPVRAWEVFVMTPAGTPLSEVRRYELDRRHFAHRRFFLFATSLGGMATFAALGEAQLDVEVRGEEAARTLPPSYDPLRGDTLVLERSLRPALKVASSFRTRAQQTAAQDLLLSQRVLLLSRDGRWLPGVVKAKNATLFDESKAVPTLEFEFYLPTERLFTPPLGTDQVTYTTPLLP